MTKEPILDVAHLAHVEIHSPKVEASVAFFKDIMGMSVAHREGKSVYMRAYEDHYHNTLIITENEEAGLGHLALRATSPQALERRVAAIEEMGCGIGWIDGDIGHGPAYQFHSPDGHKVEIFWDVEYYKAPEEEKTPLLNRPQRRPNYGVPVRRLDHINLLAKETNKNVEFYEEALGFKVRERILAEDDSDIAAWLSVSNLVHDIAIMGDALGEEGRLHHICYWYGFPQHLSDVADLLIERGYEIEAGPGKHGVTQACFLYVVEPGGNRVELFGDPGYQIFDPDWKTVEWKGKDLEKAIIWHGSNLPQEFFEYGTPVKRKTPVKNS
ncbi:catechol 2,3-dioxygenase [Thalassobacillus devorans]|uniref:Metapyrocatechase n=1 Tax=Thalassobacillus devorans TaxID=279813 RepID=A0ABQ1NFM8_9BACI|nr:catechol 2,3-dioxygenase [Thalassobacillus devorans]NIK27198.1 catechol 2,3-dioxygenase [Thalassobacillus devorans]GGC75776.1 catechol 2,3-dioxygenase [Thalassobacillus devorans]